MSLNGLKGKPLKIIIGVIIIILVFVSGFYTDRLFNKGLNLKFWEKNETSQLTKDNAYKAIVKIKTIKLGDQYNLTEESSGSGVVISSSGLVLTNYHVVSSEDSFNNLNETGYTICFSQDTDKAPICNYKAKLISRDKDLDLAVLQIEPIEGLSKSKVFDYLTINSGDQTTIGDKIVAIGYPSIGDDTITITGGIVSGKNDKYDEKWIKTDAVISFGNSGGAIIDTLGRVIGLTSAAHADTLGSLGYAINVVSINEWLKNNKNKPAEKLSFDNNLETFIKKQNSLLVGDTFTNDQPNFTLTKPSDWEFNYASESWLYIDKKSDDEGGSIVISYDKRPAAVSLDDIDSFFKEDAVNTDFTVYSIISEEAANVAQQPAKKIVYYNKDNNRTNVYIVPFENYFIRVYYNYGKDDKDKKNIDNIVNSIKLQKNKNTYFEVRNYENKELGFKMNLSNDWALLVENKVANPVSFINKKIKNVIFSVNIEKTDESNKGFTNEQYLSDVKKLFSEYNKSAATNGLYFDLTESNPDVSIGKIFVKAMKTKTTFFSGDKKKVEMMGVDYQKKIGDKYLDIGFNLMGDDAVSYSQAQIELDKLMNELMLSDK